MTNNLRIWDAVSKTDPSHTKPVEFGSRKFTSIDAHWQIMQATKQFGPVGVGWGYTVEHSVARLTDTMILAVADVTLWYREGEKAAQYGPIRGTCEVYGPKTYKGKAIPGEFVTDEDAPKKAMTDAMTKGLSHLGFSADVFLKLFDDNRYVQRMKREFAAGDGAEPAPPPAPPAASQSSAHGRALAAEEPELVANAGGRSKGTLPGATPTEAERLAARAAKVKEATDKRIAALQSKTWTAPELDDFTRDNLDWIEWMRDPANGFTADYKRFKTAHDKAMPRNTMEAA